MFFTNVALVIALPQQVVAHVPCQSFLHDIACQDVSNLHTLARDLEAHGEACAIRSLNFQCGLDLHLHVLSDCVLVQHSHKCRLIILVLPAPDKCS